MPLWLPGIGRMPDEFRLPMRLVGMGGSDCDEGLAPAPAELAALPVKLRLLINAESAGWNASWWARSSGRPTIRSTFGRSATTLKITPHCFPAESVAVSVVITAR